MKEHVTRTSTALTSATSDTAALMSTVEQLVATDTVVRSELDKVKRDLHGAETVGEMLSKTIEEQNTDLQAQTLLIAKLSVQVKTQVSG